MQFCSASTAAHEALVVAVGLALQKLQVRARRGRDHAPDASVQQLARGKGRQRGMGAQHIPRSQPDSNEHTRGDQHKIGRGGGMCGRSVIGAIWASKTVTRHAQAEGDSAAGAVTGLVPDVRTNASDGDGPILAPSKVPFPNGGRGLWRKWLAAAPAKRATAVAAVLATSDGRVGGSRAVELHPLGCS